VGTYDYKDIRGENDSFCDDSMLESDSYVQIVCIILWSKKAHFVVDV